MIKEQISTMIQSAIDEEVSCCYVYGQLDQLEKQIKAGKAAIRSGAFAEAREFNADENYHGGTWLIKNTGTKLNYDDDAEAKKMAETLKERTAELQTAWKSKQDPKNFFDKDFIYCNDDGVIIPIVSVKTAAGESITFTPSKPKLEQSTDEGKKMIFD